MVGKSGGIINKEMKRKMNQLFEEQRNTHILYPYKEKTNYFNQVLSFIEDGISAGDYVILVENDRNYPIIHKELRARLTVEQMEMVHFVNSFIFYRSSGSYHPSAIEAYFIKMVQPYVENKITFRVWSRVEWASMVEPLHLIKDFEEIADQAVTLLSFPLICAYEAKRMPDYLNKILLETHAYILQDDDLIISEDYQPTNVVK